MMSFWTEHREKKVLQRHCDIKTMGKLIASNQRSRKLGSIMQAVFDEKYLLHKMISVQPMIDTNDVVKYLTFERNEENKEISLVLKDGDVEAKSRRLKTTCGADERATIIALQNEIMREVGTDLRNNAGTVVTWEPIPRESMKEYYEDLYVKAVEISDIIHRKTLRGGTNWMLMNEKTAEPFLVGVSCCYAGEVTPATDAIYYWGTMNCRWRLIVDTLYPDNEVLMGYKGESNLDAGYFYAPFQIKENEHGHWMQCRKQRPRS